MVIETVLLSSAVFVAAVRYARFDLDKRKYYKIGFNDGAESTKIAELKFSGLRTMSTGSLQGDYSITIQRDSGAWI